MSMTLVQLLLLIHITFAIYTTHPKTKSPDKIFLVSYNDYPEGDSAHYIEENLKNYAYQSAPAEKAMQIEKNYPRSHIRRDVDVVQQHPIQFTTLVMSNDNVDETDVDYTKLCMLSGEDITGKTFPDYRNKSRYVVCLDYGTAAIMECPKTTLYNPYRSMCVPRDEVDNEECDGFTMSDICSCKYGIDENNNCRRSSPCESGKPCGKNKCHTVPSVAKGYLCECEDNIYDDCCCHGFINKCILGKAHFYKEKDGYFMHCTKDGSAYMKQCPKGMVFDESKITCVDKKTYDLDRMRLLKRF